MSKQKLDNKTKIIGIGFLLAVIIGCFLLFTSGSQKNGEESVPGYFPLKIQGWEAYQIDSLCLEVTQSYPEEWFGFLKETLVNIGVNLTPRQFEFPYGELTGEVLAQMDVQVISDSAQCEAVLEINVLGTALSSTYGNIVTKHGNSTCYAGSSVSGTLTLSAEGQDTFSTPIRGSVSTPGTITSSACPDQPYDAPFDESSAEALTDGLVQLWGEDIAVIIQDLYRTGNASEEAMVEAAMKLLRGGDDTSPAEPAAEPGIIETMETKP